MWNIMKSQIYQLSRDRFIWAVVLLFGTIFGIAVGTELANADGINGGTAFCISASWISFILVYMSALVPTRICGWDFNDKTICYEIMSGHKKSEIYFGRALLSIGFMLAITALMLGLPLLIGCLIGGWGPNIPIEDALYRIGLMVLILLRYLAEIILVSFLFQNAMLAGIFFWIVPLVFLMIPLLTGKESLSWISSLTGIMRVLEFENVRTGFADGKDITVFLTEFSAEFLQPTLIAAVILMIVCLAGGYLVFQKRDIK